MNFDQVWDHGYDMIVSMTQRAINDQLLLMADPDFGSINTNVILSFESPPGGQAVLHFYDNFDEVPKETTSDGRTVPLWATFQGQFAPTVTIPSSSAPTDQGQPQKVVLEMLWNSGTLYSADQVHSWDATGWTWRFPAELQFHLLSADDLKKGLAVPRAVLGALHRKLSSAATALIVSLDFFSHCEDPICTGGNDTDPIFAAAIQVALLVYSTELINNPESSPYHLMHNITGPDVPASLSPIDGTYSLFHDVQNPEDSTFNLIFKTKAHPTGGTNPPAWLMPYIGALACNPISLSDQCDGKIIYSARSFFGPMIVRPLQLFLRSWGYQGIDSVDRPYELFRRDNKGGYIAAYADLEGRQSLRLRGYTGFGDSGVLKWLFCSALGSSINDRGEAVLSMSPAHGPQDLNPLPPVSWAGGWIGEVVGGGYAEARYAAAQFTTQPPPTFAQQHVMLPFGDCFLAKNIEFLQGEAFSTQVTIKSLTGERKKALGSDLVLDVRMVENKIGRVLATATPTGFNAPQ